MNPPQPQNSAPPNNNNLSETYHCNCNCPCLNGLQPTQAIPPNNEQNTTMTTRGLVNGHHHHRAVTDEDQEFFKDIREGIMIVAILAAGSTYQAGLNPPGSFWQSDVDDPQGHKFKAGDPILHDVYFPRYQAFFYFNAISFLSSLVIIIFLMNKNFYRERAKIKTLQITMVLDMFAFMAAYAAGSCRRVTTSIYVFLIMGGVFLYVLWLSSLYPLLRKICKKASCTCYNLCCKLWKGTEEPGMQHP